MGPPDHKSKCYYHDHFTTVAQLRDYFLRIPGAGALVKYGKQPVESLWAFSASIIFEWTDAVSFTSKEFADVHAFAAFLDEHPDLAKCVEYVRKRRFTGRLWTVD